MIGFKQMPQDLVERVANDAEHEEIFWWGTRLYHKYVLKTFKATFYSSSQVIISVNRKLP